MTTLQHGCCPMDSFRSEVAALDQLAGAVGSGQVTSESPEYMSLEFLHERPGHFELMKAIFLYSTSEMVLIAGTRIISHIVTTEWDNLTKDDQIGLKNFIIDQLSSFSSERPVHSSLEKCLAEVALRQFPNDWPGFIEEIFSSDPPKFQIFSEFLIKLASPSSEFLTADAISSVQTSLSKAIPSILRHITDYFPSFGSSDALSSVVPYISWTSASLCIDSLFSSADPSSYKSLVEILLIPDLPLERMQTFFNILVRVLPDPSNSVDFIQFLELNLERIEGADTIDSIVALHGALLSLTFCEVSEYFEYFILSIFDSVSRSNGQRIVLYSQVLSELRRFTIENMPFPPDFILVGQSETRNSANNRLIFQQARNIITFFAKLSAGDIQAVIHDEFIALSGQFSTELFLHLVFAASCISSFIEFPSISMNLITDADAIAGFLYLSSNFLQRVPIDILSTAATLATKYLFTESTSRVAAQYILTASKYAPESLAKVIDPRSLMKPQTPDIFAMISEAVARVTISNGTFAAFYDTISQRWANIRGSNLSFDTARDLRLLMSSLIGLARADQSSASQILSEMTPILSAFDNQYLETIELLYAEFSDSISARDDVRLMMGFIRSHLQLLRELKSSDCESLLYIYAKVPPKMKPIEALDLCDEVVSEGVSIQSLRESIISPTEELISTDFEGFSEFAIVLAKLLAHCRAEDIQPCDAEALIKYLSQGDTMIVKEAVAAIAQILQGPQNELLRSFAPKMVIEAICSSIEPSHKECICDLLKIAKFSVDMTLFSEEGAETKKLISEKFKERFNMLTESFAAEIAEDIEKSSSEAEFEATIAKLAQATKRMGSEEMLKAIQMERSKEELRASN